MLTPEERSAWQDAYDEHRTPRRGPVEQKSGWYGTVFTIAAGLVTIWAFTVWLPN